MTTPTLFGHTADGTPAHLYTLEGGGVTVRITNFGGIITHIETPDRTGQMADIALGFDSLDGYLGEHPYFGATIGRCANRIANACFELDGVTCRLAANDDANCLHGGLVGFDKVVWRCVEADDQRLVLTHTSPDGDEGFPGALTCRLTCKLGNDGALTLDLAATCDRATVVNLTNHSYFNLAGHNAGTVLDHVVTLDAEAFTPVGDDLIPTGDIRQVTGTPLDFTSPGTIGDRIADMGPGYDHNLVLDSKGGQLHRAAHVRHPGTGRVLEVFTTEPGIQFYTGNFLDGTVIGKDGAAYPRHGAFCLEPQKYPDSPNQPTFPSPVLRPGDTYRHTMVFRFSTDS